MDTYTVITVSGSVISAESYDAMRRTLAAAATELGWSHRAPTLHGTVSVAWCPDRGCGGHALARVFTDDASANETTRANRRRCIARAIKGLPMDTRAV